MLRYFFFRQLAADLGWLKNEATVLCMDNKTAMALAKAPEVSRTVEIS